MNDVTTRRRTSFAAGLLLGAGLASLAWWALPRLTTTSDLTPALQLLQDCRMQFQEAVADKYMGLPQAEMVQDVPRWLGVPTMQVADDLIAMQELIVELRPDFIIETGTWMGGATLFYANVLNLVNPQGRVISVDIEDFRPQAARQGLHTDFSAFDFVLGSSVADEVVQQISERVRDHRVLVTLDSNHEGSHVLAELEAYAPLVPVGSYIVVQDTYVDTRWGYDELPISAVRKFLEAHPEFVIDNAREGWFLTNCRDGFLKRVR